METSASPDLMTADPFVEVWIRSPGKTVKELAAGEPFTCTEPEPMSMAPFVPANAKEQEASKTKTNAAFLITDWSSQNNYRNATIRIPAEQAESNKSFCYLFDTHLTEPLKGPKPMKRAKVAQESVVTLVTVPFRYMDTNQFENRQN